MPVLAGMNQGMLFDVIQEEVDLSELMTQNILFSGSAQKALATIETESVQCCVTSPPYWGLRDYGVKDQIGAETTVESFVDNLVTVFAEVRRVLKPTGTLWLNIGDSYTSGGRTWRHPDKKNPARGMSYRPQTPEGLKPKDLIGVPWRLAFALQADGWFLRSDIIWHKPNCQPESVRDRPTRSHEYLFLLTKSESYYYDYEAVKEDSVAGGRKNRRSVWSINTEAFSGAHFATFPEALVRPCIQAGTKEGDTVLDPFFGSGTVGSVAVKLNRRFIGAELNPDYVAIAQERLSKTSFVLRNAE